MRRLTLLFQADRRRRSVGAVAVDLIVAIGVEHAAIACADARSVAGYGGTRLGGSAANARGCGLGRMFAGAPGSIWRSRHRQPAGQRQQRDCNPVQQPQAAAPLWHAGVDRSQAHTGARILGQRGSPIRGRYAAKIGRELGPQNFAAARRWHGAPGSKRGSRRPSG
jgi:hypothetical protein